MTAPRVLVVDDDADGAELLQELLQFEGFHAETAGDGAGALARLGDGRGWLAVLTDLNLPDTRGDALAERVHALGAGVAVVATSGSAIGADQIGPGRPFGAAFLKPLDIDAVLAALRALAGPPR